MVRSLRFGSTPRHSRPIQTRFRFGSGPEALNLATKRNSPGHYAKGTPSRGPEGHRAPTVCRRTVSGTISLPLIGCFSSFPHGTGSLSVAGEYLALEGGPPRFARGFSCPALLGNEPTRTICLRLQGCHLLWPAFPGAVRLHKSTRREH
jgi:hypothetical protein